MICARCKHHFTMVEIPIEERVYRALSANFKCPQCQTWLEAGTEFKVLCNLGGLLIAAFTVLLLLQLLQKVNVNFWVLAITLIMGLTLFVASLFRKETKEVELDPQI